MGRGELDVSNSCSAMYLDRIFHRIFTSTDDLCNGGYVNGTDHLSNASEIITELSSRSPHIGTMEAPHKSPLLGIVKYDAYSTAYYPLLTSRCKGAHYVCLSSLRLQARIRAAETALDNWDLSRPSVLAVPPRFTFQSPTTPCVPGHLPVGNVPHELLVRPIHENSNDSHFGYCNGMRQ
jgi:hypothetical protein